MGIAETAGVAMGDAPASIVLQKCRLVNVYTQEIIPDTEIAISGDTVAYVGPDASHCVGGRTKVVDARGRHVTPGLADPHMHIDQFVLPHETANAAATRGCTTIFSDPIDAVSVGGAAGLDEFRRLCAGLPVRIFNSVPGGLPVDSGLSTARGLSRRAMLRAARDSDMSGMGEVFSWTKVTSRDADTVRNIEAMREQNHIITGHTAGMSGKKLNAYVSCGIFSCHEPLDTEQALERLRLGMWVMMREGSIRRDLGAILEGAIYQRLPLDRLMFCSDGVNPSDMQRYGHMDHCVREAVKLGVPFARAVSMASRSCFDYYMMPDMGGIAPGRRADIVVLGDADLFIPDTVIADGRFVVRDRRPARHVRPRPKTLLDTVKCGAVRPSDFAVADGRPTRERGEPCKVNSIRLVTEIITRLEGAEALPSGGLLHAAPEDDLYKVASFDRSGSGRRAVGFLRGFADVGMASTWSFHENDLVVVGGSDEDMAAAANSVIKSRGGVAVAKNGRTIASMPLRFAGIMSVKKPDAVSAELDRIDGSVRDAGFGLGRPHLVPLFLPFLALPSARMLHTGMVDVKRRRHVPIAMN